MQLTAEHVRSAVAALPESVQNAMQHYGKLVFAGGGFLRAIVAGEPVNDVDLFTEATVDAEELARYCSVNKNTEADFLLRTDNAITIDTKPATQIIRRFNYMTAHKCIDSFDFTICQAAIWWDFTGWCSVCSQDFYPDLASRRLRYTRYGGRDKSDPMNTAIRVLKFYQRGYTIDIDNYSQVIQAAAKAEQNEIVARENQVISRKLKTY